MDQDGMNGAYSVSYFEGRAVSDGMLCLRDLGTEHRIMPAGTSEWCTLRQNLLEDRTAIRWHYSGNLTIVKNKAEFGFGVELKIGFAASAVQLSESVTDRALPVSPEKLMRPMVTNA